MMRHTIIFLGAIITILVCGCNTTRSIQETEVEKLRIQVTSLSNTVECLNQRMQKTEESVTHINQKADQMLDLWDVIKYQIFEPDVMEELQSVPE
jgi:outer membrane murein-binding lipoprotein Lpp